MAVQLACKDQMLKDLPALHQGAADKQSGSSCLAQGLETEAGELRQRSPRPQPEPVQRDRSAAEQVTWAAWPEPWIWAVKVTQTIAFACCCWATHAGVLAVMGMSLYFSQRMHCQASGQAALL